MDSVRFPVEDGSSIVLAGVAPEWIGDEQPDEAAPVLGGVTDFLQDLALNGAVYGTAGALTFEALKVLGRKLRDGGILTRRPDLSMSDVQDVVRTALTDAGHATPVVFHTCVLRSGEGWDVAGKAGESTFIACADPTGQVVHLVVS